MLYNLLRLRQGSSAVAYCYTKAEGVRAPNKNIHCWACKNVFYEVLAEAKNSVQAMLPANRVAKRRKQNQTKPQTPPTTVF